MSQRVQRSGASEIATITDSGGGAAVASFSRMKTFITIQNRTGAVLHVRINGTSTLTAGAGDFVMADGDLLPFTGLEINGVRFFGAGTITVTGTSKTIFVSGWD